MIAELVIDLIVDVCGVVTITAIWFMLIVYLEEKLKEIMKRQQKIRFLCKHEWIEKKVWKHFGLTECTNHDEIELMCRKCGKKKTICIYENEVM